MTDPCDQPPAGPFEGERVDPCQGDPIIGDPVADEHSPANPTRDLELSDEQLHRIAKAIADPQRFAILGCIAAAVEIPCKTLVAEFPITQATISHHLKELVTAELIRSRRDGQMAILSCRRDVCDAYTKVLSRRLVAPGGENPRTAIPT